MLDMRWKLTRLDDIGTYIFETGFDLLSNKVRWNDVDSCYAFCVLDG